jgi:hypothetical protein
MTGERGDGTKATIDSPEFGAKSEAFGSEIRNLENDIQSLRKFRLHPPLQERIHCKMRAGKETVGSLNMKDQRETEEIDWWKLMTRQRCGGGWNSQIDWQKDM